MSTEKSAEAVRDMVREGYAGIARNTGECCGGATANADTIARHIGYSDDDVIRYGVAHDEAAFLQKPFTPAQLTKAVRAAIDSAE